MREIIPRLKERERRKGKSSILAESDLRANFYRDIDPSVPILAA